MRTPVEFFVRGEPRPQPRPRAFARKIGGKFHARVYESGTAEEWKSRVAVEVEPFLRDKFAGPCAVSLVFVFPRLKAHFRASGALKDSAPAWHTVKPDGDNLAKAVLDALTQCGLWSDDNLVCDLRVVKRYGDTPGCRVCVRELDPLGDRGRAFAGEQQASLWVLDANGGRV